MPHMEGPHTADYACAQHCPLQASALKAFIACAVYTLKEGPQGMHRPHNLHKLMELVGGYQADSNVV